MQSQDVPGRWRKELSLAKVLDHESAGPRPPLATGASQDEVLDELQGGVAAKSWGRLPILISFATILGLHLG